MYEPCVVMVDTGTSTVRLGTFSGTSDERAQVDEGYGGLCEGGTAPAGPPGSPDRADRASTIGGSERWAAFRVEHDPRLQVAD